MRIGTERADQLHEAGADLGRAQNRHLRVDDAGDGVDDAPLRRDDRKVVLDDRTVRKKVLRIAGHVCLLVSETQRTRLLCAPALQKTIGFRRRPITAQNVKLLSFRASRYPAHPSHLLEKFSYFSNSHKVLFHKEEAQYRKLACRDRSVHTILLVISRHLKFACLVFDAPEKNWQFEPLRYVR